MTTVSVSRRLKADANEVWRLVGDFGRYAEWNPSIIDCVLEDGGGQRRLTLDTGHQILEQLEDCDNAMRSLTWRVFDGQLPMAGFHGKIVVRPKESGCTVIWTGDFNPIGPESMIVPIIDEVFNRGLDGLKRQVERG